MELQSIHPTSGTMIPRTVLFLSIAMAIVGSVTGHNLAANAKDSEAFYPLPPPMSPGPPTKVAREEVCTENPLARVKHNTSQLAPRQTVPKVWGNPREPPPVVKRSDNGAPEMMMEKRQPEPEPQTGLGSCGPQGCPRPPTKRGIEFRS
ncbi:mitochondrial heat shock protein Hsp10 [Ophidiomyces ophidiicola]|nr:mitochondrial heat shock protein Hsp10 [Ophidiomyces ophidiicola]